MDIDSTMLVRGIERALVICGAIFSLWLTQKFAESNASSGTVKWEKFSIELKKIGPAVFFGLFGTSVLIYALASPIEISQRQTTVVGTEKTSETTIRYLTTPNDVRRVRILGAVDRQLGELSQYVNQIETGTITENERLELSAVIKRLNAERDELFIAAFGEETTAKYKNYVSRCEAKASSTSAQCEKLVSQIGPEILRMMENFGNVSR